jgi:hypothetical protein
MHGSEHVVADESEVGQIVLGKSLLDLCLSTLFTTQELFILLNNDLLITSECSSHGGESPGESLPEVDTKERLTHLLLKLSVDLYNVDILPVQALEQWEWILL